MVMRSSRFSKTITRAVRVSWKPRPADLTGVRSSAAHEN
jgi:hypothetical protein